MSRSRSPRHRRPRSRSDHRRRRRSTERKRSPNRGRGHGGDYASPSPPRMIERSEESAYPAQGSKTKGPNGKRIFQGAEENNIEVKELRKIQIDIRRSIPEHRVSKSPIRREINQPEKVTFSRRKGI